VRVLACSGHPCAALPRCIALRAPHFAAALRCDRLRSLRLWLVPYSYLLVCHAVLPIDPEREELRQTPRGDWWTDPDWLRSLALIDELGLSFDLQIHIPQMPAAAELVERFPNLQFILNHAGFPYITDDETLAAWREGMQLLAARPNIACKISGLGMADYDDSHIICVRGKSAAEIATSIQPFVIETIDAFGVDRCMLASNFPVDKLMCSWYLLMQQLCCCPLSFMKTYRFPRQARDKDESHFDPSLPLTGALLSQVRSLYGVRERP
jgi:hypothetical protein